MTHARRLSTAIFMGIVVVAFPPGAQADEFCMTLAENYFEQVYCELKARGEGRQLPRLHEFRNNDSTTQALLLKRPAARLGIEIKVPRQQAEHRVRVPTRLPTRPLPSTSVPATTAAAPAQSIARDTAEQLSGCKMLGVVISCGDGQFHLLGNRSNTDLADGVLSADNRMALPEFEGSLSSATAVSDYLARAYQRYISKMVEIGLGGSTMTFGKFAYLFQDLSEKGVDFAARSETMFSYLKKDKSRIAVSETVSAPADLQSAYCNRLNGALIACDGGRRNYLYARK